MKLPKLFYKIFTSGVLGIAIFLLFGTVTANAACISADFAGGDGTQSDPWQITTPAELANVGTCNGITHSSKYFILNNDIDLDVAPYNTGVGWVPIGVTNSTANAFYGKFNGDYNTISNLFINRPTTGAQGLFGVTKPNSIIENIVIENINVTGGVASAWVAW